MNEYIEELLSFEFASYNVEPNSEIWYINSDKKISLLNTPTQRFEIPILDLTNEDINRLRSFLVENYSTQEHKEIELVLVKRDAQIGVIAVHYK